MALSKWNIYCEKKGGTVSLQLQTLGTRQRVWLNQRTCLQHNRHPYLSPL